MSTTEQKHWSACVRFQEYYERHLAPVGFKAPPPVLGQTVNDYRTETLRKIKRTFLPQSHELAQVNFRGLRNDSAALAALEPQLLQTAVVEARNPATVPRGEMRQITQTDPNGMKSNIFIGQESFVKAMGRPGRRVVSFNTSSGVVDSNGQFVR
jgi:hypothetical protein